MVSSDSLTPTSVGHPKTQWTLRCSPGWLCPSVLKTVKSANCIGTASSIKLCVTRQVLLSTAPDATGATHWGQQIFFLHPAIACAPNDTVACDITIQRKKDNHRLMKVLADCAVTPAQCRPCLYSSFVGDVSNVAFATTHFAILDRVVPKLPSSFGRSQSFQQALCPLAVPPPAQWPSWAI